jgi:hypothetical protein
MFPPLPSLVPSGRQARGIALSPSPLPIWNIFSFRRFVFQALPWSQFAEFSHPYSKHESLCSILSHRSTPTLFFPAQNTTQFFVLTMFASKWLAHHQVGSHLHNLRHDSRRYPCPHHVAQASTQNPLVPSQVESRTRCMASATSRRRTQHWLV